MSLHPGVVRTELIREMSLGIRIVNALLWPLRMIIMKSAKEGAQTTLYLAMERSDKLVKGGYYSDCALAHSSDFTNSAENARILW